MRERDVSIPCRPDQGRQPTQNDGGSPRCATGINNGVRTPCKGTDRLPLPTPGKLQPPYTNTHIRSHRGKNQRQDLRNKKMGGPNDQGMLSMWFLFELKILKHLTMASRAWLAMNRNPYNSLSIRIMLSLNDFVHLYHVYASVMKFCAQIIKTETLNPLKNPPNPTAETLTLEKFPNPAKNPNPNPKI